MALVYSVHTSFLMQSLLQALVLCTEEQLPDKRKRAIGWQQRERQSDNRVYKVDT